MFRTLQTRLRDIFHSATDQRRLTIWLGDLGRRPALNRTAISAGVAGATLSVALGAWLRAHRGGGEPLMAVFLLVLLVCLRWGGLAGALNLLGGVIGAWYVHVGQQFSFNVNSGEAPSLLMAIVIGALVVAACMLLRSNIGALQTSDAQARVLAGELAHRPKNVLAVIAIISRSTFRVAR